MHGPMPARIRSGRAPSRVIAATVASITPASAPRQPPCAAPMMRELGIGEQNRRAIGREHAERDPRHRCHHRVGARVLLAPPRGFDRDRVRAVDLMAADQPIRRQPEPGRRDLAVLLDMFRHVARAEAAIQGRERALADPAPAGKKGVPYPRIGSRKFGKRRRFINMVSSAWRAHRRAITSSLGIIKFGIIKSGFRQIPSAAAVPARPRPAP